MRRLAAGRRIAASEGLSPRRSLATTVRRRDAAPAEEGDCFNDERWREKLVAEGTPCRRPPLLLARSGGTPSAGAAFAPSIAASKPAADDEAWSMLSDNCSSFFRR